MSSTAFYSRKRQFLREWRALWRIHWLDSFLGGVYALIGFYAFHQVGVSQVHNVITPFFVAGIAAGYLAFVIYAPQSRGNTLPYYFNLPRSRTGAWDAQFAFLVCTVLWMEGVILIGALLQLGGAGMTPHYRLHPEAFALPFLAIASVTFYLHVRHSTRSILAAVLAILAFAAGLYYWIAIGFWEDAEEYNNFFPPREFALSSQCAFAALLVVAAACVLVLCRSHWRRREVGEIK